MLGYAFMGKAHSRAFREIAYMTWPPPLEPRLVSIAGRDEAARRGRRAALRLTRLDDGLAGAGRRPARSGCSTTAARTRSTPSPRSRRRRRQARALREAARPGRGRELRRSGRRSRATGVKHMCALQLPLRAGGAARARDHRGGRARRDRPLPRRATCRAGAGSRRSTPGASTRRRPAPARSAISARTRSTSPATSSGRSSRRLGARPHVRPRPARSTTQSWRPSSSRRRDRDARGVAPRARADQPPRLGDQRLARARSPSTWSG